jgi:DNA repair exonuclease SbcCD ATPase subunit
MQKAAGLSQEHIGQHLAGIVTKAIRAVINKPYTFYIEFVERRNSTEADLFVTLDGHRMSVIDSTGGGLADVCSFALKVAYLLLSTEDRVLVLDEPARHLNSQQQREAFAEVVKTLCEEFNIQAIITTTVPELIDIADQIIEVTQQDGVSTCRSTDINR